jgi:hypothetical protein
LDAHERTSCYLTQILDFRQGPPHPVMGVERREKSCIEQCGTLRAYLAYLDVGRAVLGRSTEENR